MVKKKVLVCTVFALVIAVIAAANIMVELKRSNDPNPDFGMVEKIYTYPQEGIPITDCEGDTDILRAVAYGVPRNIDDDHLGISFIASRDVALTPNIYKDGVYVPSEDGVGTMGTIEKYEKGKWVEYGPLFDANAYFMIYGARMYPVITHENVEEDDSYSWTDVVFPIDEPGKYRLTYYFRESIDSNWVSPYTTGDELYSISHTVTIPKATDKPFDIIALQLNAFHYHKDEQGVWTANVDYVIRPNFGGTLYPDDARRTLEKLVDGEWVEAPVPAGKKYALYTCADDYEYRYLSSTWRKDDNIKEGFMFYFNDPNGEYRIKLDYVENEDGSGERYTLTLRLKFDVSASEE